MQREGLTKCHLAGISMGGSLAQHFAGTHPEMVDRLILCDCTPPLQRGEPRQLAGPRRRSRGRRASPP